MSILTFKENLIRLCRLHMSSKNTSDFTDLKMVKKHKWLYWLTLELGKTMVTDFIQAKPSHLRTLLPSYFSFQKNMIYYSLRQARFQLFFTFFCLRKKIDISQRKNNASNANKDSWKSSNFDEQPCEKMKVRPIDFN